MFSVVLVVFCFSSIGITTLKNFWKLDVDAVASGPTVSHCAAEL